MPTVRLDHAAGFGQPLLVLVRVHAVQQVGVAGELDQICMGGGQGLAPVDERLVRGERSLPLRQPRTASSLGAAQRLERLFKERRDFPEVNVTGR